MSDRILVIDDQASIHDDYREVLENKKSDDFGVDDALSAFFVTEPQLPLTSQLGSRQIPGSVQSPLSQHSWHESETGQHC